MWLLSGFFLSAWFGGSCCSMFQYFIPFYNCIMFHRVFVHSFVDGHLCCFHLLAAVNSAAMNIPVYVLVLALSYKLCLLGFGKHDHSFSRKPLFGWLYNSSIEWYHHRSFLHFVGLALPWIMFTFLGHISSWVSTSPSSSPSWCWWW